MARFGKNTPTVTEVDPDTFEPIEETGIGLTSQPWPTEPIEIEDHSETTYDYEHLNRSQLDAAVESGDPNAIAENNRRENSAGNYPEVSMTNIIDDAPAVPAGSVPEVPSNVVNHDADVVNMPEKPRRGRPALGMLPQLTADDVLIDEDVSPDEFETMGTGGTKAATERDAEQVKMDARVTAVHDAWLKADKPGLRTAPRKRLTVKPELKATTRGMLTRSGAYLKLRVHVYQTVHTQDGTVSIVYTAIDRPPSEKKSDKK